MKGGWSAVRIPAMGAAADVRWHGGGATVEARIRQLFEDLERCWSRFDPRSDLSRLNGDPAPVVEVPALLAFAVWRAVRAWELTEGAFDPTVHDALVAAGYDRTFDEVAERTSSVGAAVDVVGCSEIHLDADAATVSRPPGVRLDLGGIGKGLASDVVAATLLAEGVDSVVVSVGGDVRVGGRTPSGGWSIPVVDPWDGSTALTVALDAPGAVVMSSTRRRRWQTDDGRWAHHLIDPRTGRPADRGVAAVLAVAAEAWWAESVAKAALVAGMHDGAALLDRLGVEGVLVGDDTVERHVWHAGRGGRCGQPSASFSSVASSEREPMPSLP